MMGKSNQLEPKLFYHGIRGNESVDPAVILKLMFLLFYENIKSERALMRQLSLRMDRLWFCGYDLDEKTPDHSVISKARLPMQPTIMALSDHVFEALKK